MTFSIVIPAYNGGRFIERTILSVLAQDRMPDEILVFDDNSSDDTRSICARYQDRITLVHNADGPSGFVQAWNKAIDHAKSDFIGILHQDDLLAPGFLAAAETALEKHPHIRHLFCTCDYIDQQDRRLSSSYSDDAQTGYTVYAGAEYFIAYQQLGQPHIHRCPGVLTHWSVFRECRYAPEAGHIADDDFFYRVGMYTDVIGILHPLASYRIHANSITGSLEDAELVRQLIADYIYQYRQWKYRYFPAPGAYRYFARQARKYIRRYIGYALRQKNAGMLRHALLQYSRLR